MRVSIALLFVLLAMNSNQLDAQIRKIPAVVTEAFKQKYPSAGNVEWKDKITSFRADFTMNSENYEAKFNNKGEWQQTEKAIDKNKLPAAVNDGFAKSKYSDWDVTSVAHIEFKDGHVEYRVLVKKNDIEKKYLFFNKEGKLLRDTITI